MSYSYTYAETTTFTLTHAKHMSAKVATDLKRMQRLYGAPSDTDLAEFEEEVIEFLKAGYLGTVTYGFKRNGEWIEPTVRYSARDLAGGFANDDDPGRIRPGADVSGALFCSYMTYSAAWYEATDAERERFKDRLPFPRTGAPESSINGYLSSDRTYSSGGRALDRASVRSYQ